MLSPQEIEAARQKFGITPATGVANAAPDRSTELSTAWSAQEKQQEADTSTKADVATIKGTGDESPAVIAGKTIVNTPKSAFEFGKGVLEFLNPISHEGIKPTGVKVADTATKIGESLAGAEQDIGGGMGNIALQTAKEIPGTAYKMLVPQFLQHIFSGDLKSAAATIENDPVGQIAPLLFLAKSTAEAAGKGDEFNTAVEKIASPATKSGAKIAKAVGSGAAEVIGGMTGKGAASVKVAAEGTPAFRAALHGKVTPEDVVRSAENVVQNVKGQRATDYQAGLKGIGEDTTSHDISAVHDELETQLKNFGVKVTDDGQLDFSRSSIAKNGSARADIQGVYETVKDWGSQKGDRSGVGLDTLKRQLGDFYAESGQARALVQAVKGKVTDVLNTNVPGYQDMTASYAKASDLLDEIKSATGAGKDANADTVFTKLTTAMKGDKEFRIAVLKQMEAGGEPNLMDKIAGVNMRTWFPSGMIGRGVDVGGAYAILTGIFNPHVLPLFAMTSPRVMGEFINGLGWSAKKAASVVNAINTVTPYLLKASTGATAESNKKKK